jgi:hypothetical protein
MRGEGTSATNAPSKRALSVRLVYRPIAKCFFETIRPRLLHWKFISGVAYVSGNPVPFPHSAARIDVRERCP